MKGQASDGIMMLIQSTVEVLITSNTVLNH